MMMMMRGRSTGVTERQRAQGDGHRPCPALKAGISAKLAIFRVLFVNSLTTAT